MADGAQPQQGVPEDFQQVWWAPPAPGIGQSGSWLHSGSGVAAMSDAG